MTKTSKIGLKLNPSDKIKVVFQLFNDHFERFESNVEDKLFPYIQIINLRIGLHQLGEWKNHAKPQNDSSVITNSRRRNEIRILSLRLFATRC